MNIFTLIKSFILVFMKSRDCELYQCDQGRNNDSLEFGVSGHGGKFTPCVKLKGHFGNHKTFYE